MASSGIVDRIVEKRSVPGVMSFSDTLELLYMNTEAEALSRSIMKARRQEDCGGGVVVPEIDELCRDLQKSLAEHLEPRARERVQLRKVITDASMPVLIRGFLIPGPDGGNEVRFLILMEKIGRRSQVVNAESKKRFNLTDREEEIVMHVADGRTNKEIARLLEISEHTVKEHIKHILRKTNTSTRTGILAQIFRHS